jgi:hypothetical protein
MVYFAKYAAGELPQSALKSFIKQAQFERSQGKEPDGKKMWYRVDKEGRGRSGASIEVVATSKEEALEKAASNWSVRLSSLTSADAYPIRAYEVPKLGPSNPDGDYIISKFRSDGPNWTMYRFNAETWNKAEWVLKDWLTANNITDAAEIRKYTIRTDPTKAYGQPEGSSAAQSTQRYEIYNKQTGNAVEDAEGITNNRDALVRLQDYIEHGPHALQRGQATDMFGIRRVGGAPVEPNTNQGQSSRFEIYRISDGRAVEYNGQPLQVNATDLDDADERARQIIAAANLGAPQLFGVRSVLSAPISGSTLDLQRQRNDAQQGRAQTSPTGQWKIIDGLNREVYRFRSADNTRTKANELAAQWARENNFDGNYQVEPAGENDSNTQSIHQQTPQQGGTFTGIWKLVDGTGRELHRISGVGNNRDDAYRAVVPWIRNNGHDHTEGLRMVPVMDNE